jgi:hypothetical protein
MKLLYHTEDNIKELQLEAELHAHVTLWLSWRTRNADDHTALLEHQRQPARCVPYHDVCTEVREGPEICTTSLRFLIHRDKTLALRSISTISPWSCESIRAP